MPPQPLSSFPQARDVNFRIKVLDAQPELALKVMDVINTWAHIDYLATLITAKVLRADFKVVASMLVALTSADARRNAINAAIANGLPEEAELFQAIQKAIKPSRQRRNDFAHHLWGTCPQIPDALLLADPRDISMRYAEYLEAEKAGTLSSENTMFAEHSKIMVYRERDLNEEAQSARQASKFMMKFFILAEGQAASDEMRCKLLSDPRIQQALQPQSSESAL